MKKLTLILLALSTTLAVSARPAAKPIEVHYFEQAPFAFTQNGKVAGIEIEIIQAFVNWANKKKNADIQITYKAHANFDEFYNSVISGAPNVVGMGTVSINEERRDKVEFSPAYMNNISILISDGKVPTLANLGEIAEKFAKLTGLTTKGSIHQVYMEQLKSNYFPELSIETVESPAMIPVKISENPVYFGYVDIITFWSFIKKNDKFIKIHRVANIEGEKLGFILPKTNDFGPMLAEFFESGFGFTSTRQYQEILEKYLAHEVLTTVELD